MVSAHSLLRHYDVELITTARSPIVIVVAGIMVAMWLWVQVEVQIRQEQKRLQQQQKKVQKQQVEEPVSQEEALEEVHPEIVDPVLQEEALEEVHYEDLVEPVLQVEAQKELHHPEPVEPVLQEEALEEYEELVEPVLQVEAQKELHHPEPVLQEEALEEYEELVEPVLQVEAQKELHNPEPVEPVLQEEALEQYEELVEPVLQVEAQKDTYPDPVEPVLQEEALEQYEELVEPVLQEEAQEVSKEVSPSFPDMLIRDLFADEYGTMGDRCQELLGCVRRRGISGAGGRCLYRCFLAATGSNMSLEELLGRVHEGVVIEYMCMGFSREGAEEMIEDRPSELHIKVMSCVFGVRVLVLESSLDLDTKLFQLRLYWQGLPQSSKTIVFHYRRQVQEGVPNGHYEVLEPTAAQIEILDVILGEQERQVLHQEDYIHPF